MPNMSYCRFENTSMDLRDCLDAIECGEADDLSQNERRGLASIIEVAQQLLDMREEWGLDEIAATAAQT